MTITTNRDIILTGLDFYLINAFELEYDLDSLEKTTELIFCGLFILGAFGPLPVRNALHSLPHRFL